MRTAIVGDIGGQIDVFHDVIKSLGGDPESGKFPAGLTVIQVGDIARFNPSPDLDSLACVKLADKLIDANAGKYIQLLGNHETPILGGILHPAWTVDELPGTESIIKSWWNDGKAHLSVAISVVGERDTLVTHAGLTRGYMNRIDATTAKEAVTALNGYVGQVNLGGIERPGGLVTGVNDLSADIFWALCGAELNGSWWNESSGFNQIHGHACVYEWEKGVYWPDVSDEIIANTVVNVEDRFTLTTHPAGEWVRSVDWVLQNTKKRQQWPVLILEDTEVFLG